MLPLAYIVHRMPQRIRLRIPDRQHDEHYFNEVERALSTAENITSYSTNLATASVLLHYSNVSQLDVIQALNKFDLFSITTEKLKPKPVFDQIVSVVSGVDRSLKKSTADALDLRTIIFSILAVLIVRQFIRGELTGPAIPLMLSAFNTLNQYANNTTTGVE